MNCTTVPTQKQGRRSWKERINKLVVYKEKNSNCNVPQSQGALGNWVNQQRAFYKKSKLSRERTAQLEGIGFIWERQDKYWKERFNKLVVCKEKGGDCNVPFRQGALGKWVMTQRQSYKNGNLSRERTTLLEGIRFVWKPKRGQRKSLTQVQFDLPVDESHKEVGQGSIESITGISKSTPSVFQMDTKSSTLLSDSLVTTNGFTTETSVTKSDAISGTSLSEASQEKILSLLATLSNVQLRNWTSRTRRRSRRRSRAYKFSLRRRSRSFCKRTPRSTSCKLRWSQCGRRTTY